MASTSIVAERARVSWLHEERAFALYLREVLASPKYLHAKYDEIEERLSQLIRSYNLLAINRFFKGDLLVKHLAELFKKADTAGRPVDYKELVDVVEYFDRLNPHPFRLPAFPGEPQPTAPLKAPPPVPQAIPEAERVSRPITNLPVTLPALTTTVPSTQHSSKSTTSLTQLPRGDNEVQAPVRKPKPVPLAAAKTAAAAGGRLIVEAPTTHDQALNSGNSEARAGTSKGRPDKARDVAPLDLNGATQQTQTIPKVSATKKKTDAPTKEHSRPKDTGGRKKAQGNENAVPAKAAAPTTERQISKPKPTQSHVIVNLPADESDSDAEDKMVVDGPRRTKTGNIARGGEEEHDEGGDGDNDSYVDKGDEDQESESQHVPKKKSAGTRTVKVRLPRLPKRGMKEDGDKTREDPPAEEDRHYYRLPCSRCSRSGAPCFIPPNTRRSRRTCWECSQDHAHCSYSVNTLLMPRRGDNPLGKADERRIAAAGGEPDPAYTDEMDEEMMLVATQMLRDEMNEVLGRVNTLLETMDIRDKTLFKNLEGLVSSTAETAVKLAVEALVNPASESEEGTPEVGHQVTIAVVDHPRQHVAQADARGVQRNEDHGLRNNAPGTPPESNIPSIATSNPEEVDEEDQLAHDDHDPWQNETAPHPAVPRAVTPAPSVAAAPPVAPVVPARPLALATSVLTPTPIPAVPPIPAAPPVTSLMQVEQTVQQRRGELVEDDAQSVAEGVAKDEASQQPTADAAPDDDGMPGLVDPSPSLPPPHTPGVLDARAPSASSSLTEQSDPEDDARNAAAAPRTTRASGNAKRKPDDTPAPPPPAKKKKGKKQVLAVGTEPAPAVAVAKNTRGGGRRAAK